MKPFYTVLILIAWAATASAAQINWRAKVVGAKLLSTSAPIGAGFTFELGAFTGTFVPTRENASQLRENWSILAETPYDPQTSIFAASTELLSNASPFAIGSRAYIWGFDAFGETILLTSPAWTWPEISGPPGFPTNFFTSDASATAIVGVISNSANAQVHLRAEQIDTSANPQNYDQWIVDNFTDVEREDVTISGPDADPDNDGVGNLLEFAFNTRPRDPASVARTRISRNERTTTLELATSLNPSVALSIESSATLVSWEDEPSIEIQETSSLIRIRVASENSFFRFRIEL